MTRTERILDLMTAADSTGTGVREAIAATVRRQRSTERTAPEAIRVDPPESRGSGGVWSAPNGVRATEEKRWGCTGRSL
jgi:hypothetical protein